MEVGVRTGLAVAAWFERAGDLFKGDVEFAEEEGWAEGPGGVVFVGDVEAVGHFGFCLVISRWCCCCCLVRRVLVAV